MYIKGDRAVLTSLDLAEVFGKEHAKVIRSIERELEYISKSASQRKGAKNGVVNSDAAFVKTSYKDKSGKSNPLYELMLEAPRIRVELQSRSGWTGRSQTKIVELRA